MAPIMPPGVSEVFPTLYSCTKIADGQRLYDVQFYPYPTVDDDQIFAVVGSSHVLVCRPKLDADPPFEVLRWFQNAAWQSGHSFNTVAWSRDLVTGKPLLCVAGEKPKQILILDVETGLTRRTLVGHGNAINGLAISPLSPNLLASASADYTVRLWNLDPEYEREPTVAIFAGEGHRQHLQACHFHPNGRWMLTAGLDTAVCLWAVPSLQDLERDHEQESHPKPKTIYYPHFHSTEVHSNYVDTVVFYGDLIISRAARDQSVRDVRNEILLWKIDGFDSDDDPPSEPPIPAPGLYTRSSFPHPKTSRGFQRLLTFDMPNTTRFYFRFGLLHAPGMRPILAMGNEVSRFLFWDLQKLEEGYDLSEEKEKKEKKPKKPKSKRPRGEAENAVNQSNLNRLGNLRNQPSAGSEGGSGTADPSSTSLSAPPERKYDLGDNFMPLKPHHSVLAATTLSAKDHFATAQVAWSPDGTWMVGAGDRGMICMFHRDKSAV